MRSPRTWPGMSHGDTDSSMPGMMSETDMTSLKQASGAAFDRQFLTMMIAHHEGAIEMATSEQSKGKNASAVDLAKQIETAQTREIKAMEGLLKS